MNKFKVRVYDVGLRGFFHQADDYADYRFTSDRTLEQFSVGLNRAGFLDSKKGRWIMPASILWVQQENG